MVVCPPPKQKQRPFGQVWDVVRLLSAWGVYFSTDLGEGKNQSQSPFSDNMEPSTANWVCLFFERPLFWSETTPLELALIKRPLGVCPGRLNSVLRSPERHRHRDTETQRHRDTETQRHRDTETQRHRDTETQRHRDTETQRHRDTETTETTETQRQPQGHSQIFLWSNSKLELTSALATRRWGVRGAGGGGGGRSRALLIPPQWLIFSHMTPYELFEAFAALVGRRSWGLVSASHAILAGACAFSCHGQGRASRDGSGFLASA